MKNTTHLLPHSITLIKITCFFITILLLSCNTSGSKKLERALAFAGDNRIELEKVLQHYHGEPEKLAAATFLIENMPRWYGYEGTALDSIYALLQRRYNGIPISDAERDHWKSFPFHSLPKVYDAHVITADYLIENIELAFAVKEKYPWNRNLPFEDFCEYLLPYRIGNEPLTNWRKMYYDTYTSFLDTAYQGTDVIEACNILAGELKRNGYIWNQDFTIPGLSGTYLFDTRIGVCYDICCITWYCMRAGGIPVAIDQYIWSPEYQNRHMWNSVRDTTGKFLPFWFPHFEANRNMEDDGRKKGKVYRQLYGLQPEKFKGISSMQNVPILFRNRFTKDVSENYWQNEITVMINNEKETFAYLGVFGPREWIPIDIGKVTNKYVTFRSLEEKIIYQPLYSEGNRHRPAGYPFLIDNKKIHIFQPYTDQETIEIDRKMALTNLHIEYMNRFIIGAKIEGANRKDFTDAQLLHTFTDSIFTGHNEIIPMSKGPFRYFRYLSADGKCMEIAELAFYEDPDLIQPIPLQILNLTSETEGMKKFIDGDILTYYASRNSFSVDFDAGEQKRLERIVYYPRNDDNFVRRGELYELFYQDGINGWVSLGKQTATQETLTYQVPKNAVLWLRNLTKGREEQIFICKDGKQLFVRDII